MGGEVDDPVVLECARVAQLLDGGLGRLRAKVDLALRHAEPLRHIAQQRCRARYRIEPAHVFEAGSCAERPRWPPQDGQCDLVYCRGFAAGIDIRQSGLA